MHIKRVFQILSAFLAVVLLFSCSKTGNQAQPQLKTIKFANLPYGDHTYSSIGVAKGWFRDVGIDLQADTIKIDNVVADLENGAYDVVSVPPGILFSAYETAPGLCTFVFGDLFQGYALMAQPGKGYKTYDQFIAEHFDHTAAVKAVVRQMKGKTFAYPTENAIKPFIDFALSEGGLTRKDFKSLVLDDPLTVNAMRTRQADFQVGGVPSRIALQKEGFIPILTSVDLAKGARPSADSKELASILQNGWAMKKDLYTKDHATALRLASVNYRIMKFMQSNRKEAIDIHMDYLSKVTGQKFTPADGQVIYDSLDPFVTFEDQRAWFNDKNSPFYYEYVNGAILKTFIAQNIYKGTPPTVTDVIYAAETYHELERLKAQTDGFLAKLQAKPSLPSGVVTKVSDAKRFYDWYDYYDAERIAEEAVKESETK